MADAALLEQIRPGMQVRTSDGKTLGKVRLVHERETECYVEVTPRGALWKPWQFIVERKRLFLPSTVVADVAGRNVQVSMDAKTAQGCTWRPTWITQEIDDPESYRMIGGG